MVNCNEMSSLYVILALSAKRRTPKTSIDIFLEWKFGLNQLNSVYQETVGTLICLRISLARVFQGEPGSLFHLL